MGRFENLAEDFYKVSKCDRSTFDDVTQTQYAKRRKRKNIIRKYYTSWSRDIIEKVFEKDLRHFGYEFKNE